MQPLRLVTADTCLFHYLVPPPMSPSSKSVSTPSEAGSQDSGDGAVGSRYVFLKIFGLNMLGSQKCSTVLKLTSVNVTEKIIFCFKSMAQSLQTCPRTQQNPLLSMPCSLNRMRG